MRGLSSGFPGIETLTLVVKYDYNLEVASELAIGPSIGRTLTVKPQEVIRSLRDVKQRQIATR